MHDLIVLAVTAAFFGLSVALVAFFDRLMER
jgi:hypothetical protein